MTKFPNRADRLYELRPCHTRNTLDFDTCHMSTHEALTHQTRDVAELQDGEVSGKRGLFAFFADNTETNIGRLNHANVVASVTNGCGLFLRVVLDQLDNLGLLSRRATAAYDSRSFARNLCKHIAVVVEADLQRVTVDDQTAVFFAGKDVQLRIGLLLLFDHKRMNVLNIYH